MKGTVFYSENNETLKFEDEDCQTQGTNARKVN